MSNLPDTSSGGGTTTTQSQALQRPEVKARTAVMDETRTDAQYSVGSVPSGVPEVPNQGGGYVFRIPSGRAPKSLTIRLNTKKMAEQARMRRLNEALRGARRR